MEKNELIRAKGAEQNYFEKRLLRIIALAAAILLSILFCIAFALDFEPSEAMFKNGSVLGQVVFYASLIAAAVMAVLAFVLVKKQKPQQGTFPKENEYVDYYTLDNAFVRIVRICVAVIVLSQAVVSAVAHAKENSGIIKIAGMLVLGVCLALYFVPEVTEKLGNFGGRAHIACGVISLFWFMLNVIFTYTQRKFAFSSEYLVLSSVSYILLLLALTYEMRYHLDGGYLRARLATSCAAFVLGFAFGLGRMIMLLTHGPVSLLDTSNAVICLAVSVYFGTRIFFYEED